MPEQQKNKIAIFRALFMGDMLCAVPAFRALRSAFPRAEISLIGLRWSKDFVRQFHRYIDRHIEFTGFPGIPEQPYEAEKISSFLAAMQKEKFDMVIQMQGSGKITNSLVTLFKGKRSAGSYIPGNFCPDMQTYVAYEESLPEVYRNLSVVKKIGAALQGDYLEFPIGEPDKVRLKSLPFYRQIVTSPFICVHCGARDPNRRWNPVYFAHLADRLALQGYTIVLTGSKEEQPIADKVISAMSSSPINVVGKLSIKETAAVISLAKLVVTNCTSISHIADALHVPSVILFLSSDRNRWSPLDQRLHRNIAKEKSENLAYVMAQTRDLLKREFCTNEPK